MLCLGEQIEANFFDLGDRKTPPRFLEVLAIFSHHLIGITRSQRRADLEEFVGMVLEVHLTELLQPGQQFTICLRCGG